MLKGSLKEEGQLRWNEEEIELVLWGESKQVVVGWGGGGGRAD
jgi:hypothetical protein